MDQNRYPIYETLLSHIKMKPISYHVPGHKNGMLVQEMSWNNYFSHILKLDVTELNGLDDLHSPEGMIKEAELLLTDFYRTKQSYFLVNGSTVGNLTMIMAVLKEDDEVLVQRNCHKSVLNGISLVKARPVFLQPDFHEDWGVAGGISSSVVEEALSFYPHANAIILTYPNYYGMINDLESIIEIAHQHNIPVLIDEAHGAHFAAGNHFPPSAVKLKADAVVQSAHKTLPAMTMGAYLHINSDRIDKGSIRKYLSILQSSSPSYPIMASLDLARHYLASFTKEDEQYTLEKIASFRSELMNIKGIKLLQFQDGKGDPLKITIQSETALSGFELQEQLEKKGVFTELADPYNVLFVFPLLKQGTDFPMEQTVQLVKEAVSSYEMNRVKTEKPKFRKTSITKVELNEEQMKKMHSAEVPLSMAVGQISAQMVIPYPPGIPLLYPGERITEDDLNLLRLLLDKGARFQQGENLIKGFITIYK